MMTLGGKLLGAATLLPFAGAHSAYTPVVLRPYPTLKNKMNIFCHMDRCYLSPFGQILSIFILLKLK
jgi:hypothetical protein